MNQNETEKTSNLYKNFFNKSADAMLIIEDNKFIDCNKAALKMLKYENKEDLLKCHPSEISPEKQPDGKLSFEKANEIMEIAYKQGHQRFEWEHKRKDGSVFPVEVSLTAIEKDSSKILHTVWRDISDRKQAEKNLKKSNKKWQTTFDSINDSICLLDVDGKIIQYNSATKNFSRNKNENYYL